MENLVCDLCGRAESWCVYRVIDTNYGTPGQFSVVQCRHCNLVYLNPRPSQSERATIYPETRYDPFSAIHQTRDLSSNSILWKRARQFTEMRRPGRMLDVGCADGLFLRVMQSYGWECIGVEPNQRMAEFGQRRWRLDVWHGDIFDVNDLESFDLITFWDVLEHTPSPRNALFHARKLLVSHGVLALNVPNWDSLERRIFRERWIAIDAPRHFYHFAPATISRLLQVCGFQVESLDTRAPVLSLASNLLRLAGDIVLRRATSFGNPQVLPRIIPSPRRRLVIRAVNLGLIPLNAVINLLNRGSDLTILAHKAD